ncbi:MAG: alpha/beta hydrolase [Actinomycetota bacterium]|nr:alpha/beta hydrolase [Actinomycetota bacterium]
MNTTTTRPITVEGAGGTVELAVREAGVGGRPLLLVHGFTGSGEDFGDFIDRFAAEGWHVVAPDQRGHGDAGHKPDDEGAYTIDHYVGDLFGLLDALGWDTAVVLGHSLGGMIVQTAILERPERFEALVLMDTSHRTLKGDPGGIQHLCDLARTKGMTGVLELMQSLPGESLTGEAPSAARVKATRRGYEEFGARKMLAVAPAMYSSVLCSITGQTETVDRLDRLGAISVPTLVLVGEEDRPFVNASKRMADTIPGAQLVVILDAAHSPQFENPEAWWEAMTAFLASV